MTNSSRITFACSKCGEPVGILKDDPPKDEDSVFCHHCGHVFGAWGVVRKALVKAGKAEVDKMIESRLGKKPTRREGQSD